MGIEKEVRRNSSSHSSFEAQTGPATSVQLEPSARNQGNNVRLALLLLGLSLSVACVSLDNTILSNAIPKISQEFQTIDDVGWYGSAYFLAICCVNLAYGNLYTLFSTKRVFLAAVALFEIGSLVCGVAPTSTGLIIGRAVAGLGSGGILPGAILMISQNLPLRRRALFNGLIMSMASIAAVLGPVVGGAFTEHATWRWCFWINLPIGAVTLLSVICLFRDPPASRAQQLSIVAKCKTLDIFGFVSFASGICCLVLALEWGGSKYAWDSALIVVLFVVSAILFVILALVERLKKDRAMIPPRIIAKRDVWAATSYAAFLAGATYTIAYYFPIWLQAVKDASPTKSGIMNLPMILSITVSSLLAGGIVNLLGYYTPVMIVGSFILTIGCGMCGTLDPKSGSAKWIGYQVLVGMGAGLGFNLPLLAVQTSLTSDDHATGTAMIIFGQNISSTLLITLAQNVFQSILKKSVRRYAPSIDPQAVLAAGAADFSKNFPPDTLPYLKLAYNHAVIGTFFLCTAGAGVSLFFVVFLRCLSVKQGRKSNENAHT